MKSIVKSFSLIGVILTLIVLACSKDNPSSPEPQQKITAINIDASSIEIKAGDSTTLSVKHTPSTLSAPSYTWSSTNASIATVVNGKLKALKVGETTIKAEVSSLNLKSEIRVKVLPVTANSLTLTASKNTINIGEKVTVNYQVLPINTTDKETLIIEWSSDKSNIATVSNGEVTAIAAGTAEITAKIKDTNISGKFTVIVKAIDVASLSVSPTQSTLEVNQTVQLTTTVLPTNATNKKVTYQTSDATIATVSADGLVKSLKSGTATITVTTEDGTKTATFKLTVNAIAVNALNVTLSKTSINVGETAKATASISPSNAANQTITWTSSNSAVARVDNTGQITGVAAGSVDIIATSHNGKTAKQTIQVSNIIVSSIAVSLSKSSILIGETSLASATINPSNATNKTITWTSSNASIAKVDNNGQVTAVAVGTADIIATSNNGKTAKQTIQISSPVVLATGVSVTASSTNIWVGNTTQASAVISPNNTTNKTITWSSSDQTVATVNANGLITGLKEGTINITATTSNGKTGSIMIMVRNLEVTSMSISNARITLAKGSQFTLTYGHQPSNASPLPVTWSSDVDAVAAVDRNGVVTAGAIGITGVTATANNGKKATCEVTVSAMSRIAVPTQTKSTVVDLQLDRSNLDCRVKVANNSDGVIKLIGFKIFDHTGALSYTSPNYNYRIAAKNYTDVDYKIFNYRGVNKMQLIFESGSSTETIDVDLKNLGRQ